MALQMARAHGTWYAYDDAQAAGWAAWAALPTATALTQGVPTYAALCAHRTYMRSDEDLPDVVEAFDALRRRQARHGRYAMRMTWVTPTRTVEIGLLFCASGAQVDACQQIVASWREAARAAVRARRPIADLDVVVAGVRVTVTVR